jgi:hypothetical protein
MTTLGRPLPPMMTVSCAAADADAAMTSAATAIMSDLGPHVPSGPSPRKRVSRSAD